MKIIRTAACALALVGFTTGVAASQAKTSDPMRRVDVASAAAMRAGVVANWSSRWSATVSTA